MSTQTDPATVERVVGEDSADGPTDDAGVSPGPSADAGDWIGNATDRELLERAVQESYAARCAAYEALQLAQQMAEAMQGLAAMSENLMSGGGSKLLTRMLGLNGATSGEDDHGDMQPGPRSSPVADSS